MSFASCCRTCLSNNTEMREIDMIISITGNDVRLTDILETFYNYQILDEGYYPSKICINCVHHLTMTYSFKYLIEASAKTLAQHASIVSYSEDNCDNGFDSNDQKPLIKYSRQRMKRNIKKEVEIDTVTESLYCVKCKADFNSTKLLYEHCLKEHPSNCDAGRDCEYCNEKFDDFRSLVMHKKLHLKPYICENCWDGFYNISDLDNHTCEPKNRRNMKPGRTLKQCDQCGKSYPPGYISVHMLTHGSARRYSCKYCHKTFKVPGSLNSHILWNHKRTRNHKCEACNATFITASAKSSHVRKHHLKETKYGCESCTKRFFSKSELERHMLTHTGVKNFHCQSCDKSYQTRYGLNVHLKSHTQLNMSVMNLDNLH